MKPLLLGFLALLALPARGEESPALPEQPAAAAPARSAEEELSALRPVLIGKRYLDQARKRLAVQLARMRRDTDNPGTWIEDNAGSEVMLRQLAARARFEPRISTMADDLLAKTGMVAAGLGVALVPDLLVPSLRADLTVLRLKRPTYRGIYLISRTDRTDLGPLVDALGVG